jgi:hypothetical protein
MALLKVKEDKDLMRDSVSNAILSTNNNELSEYEEAINDINNIKSELSEIKSLLTQLVGK